MLSTDPILRNLSTWSNSCKLCIYDFRPLEGTKKIFRYDFRNLQGRNRGIRFENKKKPRNSSKSVVHDDPYICSIWYVIPKVRTFSSLNLDKTRWWRKWSIFITVLMTFFEILATKKWVESGWSLNLNQRRQSGESGRSWVKQGGHLY